MKPKPLGASLGALFLLLACLVPVRTAFAEDPSWKISGSASYESGKFGTGSRVTTLYLPLTLKYYLPQGDLSLTASYLFQEGTNVVTVLEGIAVPIQKPKNAKKKNSAVNGLGDTVLKGSYYLLEENGRFINVSLIGKIKFPTADENRGLGTGQFDEEFGMELTKRVRTQWTLFTDFYYTFIGNPPGFDLKDRFSFDVGVAYRINSPLTLSLFYDQSTALLPGGSISSDLSGEIEYRASRSVRLFAELLIGLADGSPATGGTIGASVRF